MSEAGSNVGRYRFMAGLDRCFSYTVDAAEAFAELWTERRRRRRTTMTTHSGQYWLGCPTWSN